MWRITTLSLISLVLTSNSSPLSQNAGAQTPFRLSKGESTLHPVVGVNRLPSIESALTALRGASAQVVETFENVMSELGDASKHLTWSLPRKTVKSRPDEWDFKVSSDALPDHALRVKKPNSLGVDDVKQV